MSYEDESVVKLLRGKGCVWGVNLQKKYRKKWSVKSLMTV